MSPPCPRVPPRFRLVPFLVELRAVMDWVWTDTTLSLSNWMCVEDIYANIFIIKCSRETEKVQPLCQEGSPTKPPEPTLHRVLSPPRPRDTPSPRGRRRRRW